MDTAQNEKLAAQDRQLEEILRDYYPGPQTFAKLSAYCGLNTGKMATMLRAMRDGARENHLEALSHSETPTLH
ncbi:MAG: hypothetical protein WDN10_03745 [bacterium]